MTNDRPAANSSGDGMTLEPFFEMIREPSDFRFRSMTILRTSPGRGYAPCPHPALRLPGPRLADMRNPANRMGATTGPARCPACRLFQSDCLCSLLPHVPTRTRVVVVLHQLEDHKTSNTGRLAHRCLPDSAIVFRGDPARARRDPLARAAARAGQDPQAAALAPPLEPAS